MKPTVDGSAELGRKCVDWQLKFLKQGYISRVKRLSPRFIDFTVF
jgi:hypothetical protein